ncbi:secreted frizzled-related protein 3 isoform X3 [Daphnia magna]|uniref:secreted frizzled-related protein 3 isoform X3 n=1 Tax=Daphnia magna TaxID=35525 RepID=UPI0006DFDCFC|nr:secreted frizzled-related protein 3 isoform X3 [Daphnia magna]
MVTVVSCITQPSVTAPAVNSSTMSGNCQSITIPMCQQMPYNATRMPNLLGMTHQDDALIALEQFRYLPDTNCSPYLVFFLCVIYTPICTAELPSFLATIPPCRQVCEQVKSHCEPLIKKMGFIWPPALECFSFPDVTKAESVCLTPEAILKQNTTIKNPENCPCFRHPKLKQRLYLKRRFDFAVRGRVEWSETFGSLTLTNIEVIEVFKHGKVRIDSVSREIFWTNTSCGTCPRLDPGREYFLLGHEDVTRQRLLYTHLSVGLEWRKKYAMLIGKWEKAKKQTSNTGGN